MLGLHTKLKALQVGGNPLKQIWLQIIDKGSDAVMRFLRDKFNEAEDTEIEPWVKHYIQAQEEQPTSFDWKYEYDQQQDMLTSPNPYIT